MMTKQPDQGWSSAIVVYGLYLHEKEQAMTEAQKCDYFGYPPTCKVCGAKARFAPPLNEDVWTLSGYVCGVWVCWSSEGNRHWLVTTPVAHEKHEAVLLDQLAQAVERVGELEADLETMTRTAANQGDLLDQAQAEVGMLKMGFEPAPTADAYEAVCEARTKWQERAEKAKAENMRLRAIVDRLPKTVDGMPIVPGMTVFIPHPRPSNLITEREVLAPYGTLACLTKEPAHSGCCESTAHRLARECYSTREAALAASEAMSKPNATALKL